MQIDYASICYNYNQLHMIAIDCRSNASFSLFFVMKQKVRIWGHGRLDHIPMLTTSRWGFTCNTCTGRCFPFSTLSSRMDCTCSTSAFSRCNSCWIVWLEGTRWDLMLGSVDCMPQATTQWHNASRMHIMLYSKKWIEMVRNCKKWQQMARNGKISGNHEKPIANHSIAMPRRRLLRQDKILPPRTISYQTARMCMRILTLRRSFRWRQLLVWIMTLTGVRCVRRSTLFKSLAAPGVRRISCILTIACFW